MERAKGFVATQKIATAPMMAVRMHGYGGPEVLRYEQAPRPRPGPGEVLARVRAAGVNPLDWKVAQGHLRERLGHTLPLIPGWDFSGVVEETGPGVAGLRIGDEVFSRPDFARDGAYAEYIVVRESEVAAKPISIDHLRAAALPLAALTAWQAFFDVADLTSGQRLLIHAAAGGVGHLAVQLANWCGAHVIGTASAGNLEFVRELGADQVIDYQAARFEDAVSGVDLVLDAVGGETLTRSWPVLRKGGILVSIVARPDQQQAIAHGVRAASVFVRANADQLGKIAGVVDSGQLRPVVQAVFPLAEAARAWEVSQAGHVRGKIVLQVP